MGLIEEGPSPQHETNMLEQSKIPTGLDRDRKYDPLTPDSYPRDHEKRINEIVEQKGLNEAQKTEKKLVSQEKSDDVGEIGLNDGRNSQKEDTKKRESSLENVKIHLDSAYLEAVSQYRCMGLEHMGTPAGLVSVYPGGGVLIPVEVEANYDSVLLENDDRGSFGQGSKENAKLKGLASSSWVLSSKSPKAPEPFESVEEGGSNVEKRRERMKLQKNTVSEFSRTRTHLRYLLHRIKYEQTKIDAYSAEGWRGQSLEKLKPEKELEKANSHILCYKLKIRGVFQHIDQSLAVGKLPESLFDSKGEIHSEDIFCAKCGSKDLTLDNDIILCDGACQRGFHQLCLEPPLLKKDIPPGDQSWLCPGCECKADCIYILKDIQGTQISIIDSWEKIFPEAAAATSGKKMDDGSGSSSDDSEDEEYDPDKPDSSKKLEEYKSSSDESSSLSASNDLTASHNNERHMELPSDDSEDDDFDPSAPDQDNKVKQDGSSSDFTSDSEDLGNLIEDETVPSNDPGQTSTSAHHRQEPLSFIKEIPNVSRKKRQSFKDELSYLMEASAEPLCGKRRVQRLDYQKLNDETYGSCSDSSDKDFDETITQKRRKTDQEKTEVKSSNKSLVTQSNKHKEDENQIEEKHLPKRTQRNHIDRVTNQSSVKMGSTSARNSTRKWLSEATAQRLHASFRVNQYPDKAMKENLATELGLAVRQVTKWFENTRWSFNHRPRLESASAERQPEPQPTIGADGTHSSQNGALLETNTISVQNHITKPKEERA